MVDTQYFSVIYLSVQSFDLFGLRLFRANTLLNFGKIPSSASVASVAAVHNLNIKER